MKKHTPQSGEQYRVVDKNDVHYNQIGTVLTYEEWYYYPVHLEFEGARKMAYRIEELELVEPEKARR